jgi:hypothetical protein
VWERWRTLLHERKGRFTGDATVRSCLAELSVIADRVHSEGDAPAPRVTVA